MRHRKGKCTHQYDLRSKIDDRDTGPEDDQDPGKTQNNNHNFADRHPFFEKYYRQNRHPNRDREFKRENLGKGDQVDTRNDSNAPIIQSTASNSCARLSRVAAAVVSISDGVKGQDQMRSESQIASREPALMADVSTG